MPKDCYFEAHFGVLCTEAKRKDLQQVAEKVSGHLSRNVFKRIDADLFKIMLTARRYDGTREDFQEYVDVVLLELKNASFDVDKTITEFAVYDTRVNHDASWISS